MTNHTPPNGAPSWGEMFQPKLVTALREGYSLATLKADAVAGLTVAIVALPLSMAIAISSGVTPEAGLFSAIVGGFLISALGGSRFQIGGPAGAFIVLVSACVADIGFAGLATACIIAGLIMIAGGLLRLGTYIKFIPYPVTVGFTAGIGVIIFASQVREALGLRLAGGEPGPLLPKIEALWAARGTLDPATLGVTAGAVALILTLRRWRPHWPALLIAVVAMTVLAQFAHLPVATIQSRFGGLPSTLRAPHLPALSPGAIRGALPYGFSFALLGAIESLLSAVVADGMSGRHHRSNAELVAQGIANIVSPLFGGMVVTGTIARTATNVRAGARTPVAGMLHALIVMAAMFLFAPWASLIPLAALAGVLMIVSWNMIERREAAALLTNSRGDAVVLAATFLLVTFRDLTEGIVVGFLIGSLLFIRRMADAARVDVRAPLVEEDKPDGTLAYHADEAGDRDVLVYRIQGAFFFGAASTVGTVLERISGRPRVFVIDFAEVPFLDTSGARMIAVLHEKFARVGTRMMLTGTDAAMRRTLVAMGLREPDVAYYPAIADALAEARKG